MRHLRQTALLSTIVLLQACASAPVVPPTQLVGEYTTVSESSCNVSLALLPSRVAKIVSSCRLENGTGRDESKETTGSWSATDHQITVRYAGGADELEFAAMLPYAPFGRRGAGPGLRVIRTSGAASALSGYDALWRAPVDRTTK